MSDVVRISTEGNHMTVRELIERLQEFEPYKDVDVDGYAIKDVSEIDDPESPRDGHINIQSERKAWQP